MKLKRLTALLLSAVMLVPYAVTAEEETAEPTAEVQATDFEEAERLYKLFLLESKPEDLTKEITRAEAVSYFLSFSGLEAGKDTGSYSFSDIDRKTQAAAHIEQAYMNGIIYGYEDNTFRPDEPMTVAQAAVVFINILGYNKTANTNEYPYGIMQTANELGITKGLSLDPKANITLDVFLKMMDNAKDTPILELDIENLYKGSYIVDNDTSFLSKKHEIFYDKGIMTANEYTSLTSDTGYINSVVIDNVKYELSERASTESELIGCEVEFYYYESRGDKVLLWAAPTSRNEVLEIDSDYLVDYANNKYVYMKNFDNGREYKATVDQYADVIYNGMVDLHPAANNSYKPAYGYVRLVDNDGDGKYEVVIVEDYKTMLVGSTFADSYIVRDMYTSSNEVCFEETGEKTVYYFKNGEKASFSAIAQDSVISWTESRSDNSSSLIKVYISDNSIEGSVSAKTKEYGIEYAKIEGEFYKLTDYAVTYADIQTRDSGVFFFDFKGAIVGSKAVFKAGLQYGYMMKAYKDTDDEEKVVLKMLTLNGTILYFDMAEKAKFNGEKLTCDEIIDNLKYGIDKATPYSKPVGQPVKYTTNSKGEITKLITSTNTPGGSADVNSERIVPYYTDVAGATYYPKNRNYGMMFGFTDDSVCFRIPDVDSQLKGIATDEDFSVDDMSIYTHQNGMKLQGLDPDDMNYCSLALRVDVLGSDTLENKSDPYAMVDSISTLVNDDDEIVTRIHALAQGSEVSLDITEKTGIINAESADKISKGSIIQYKLDDKGNVSCVKVIIDPNSKFTPADTYDGNRTRENVYVRGQVQMKDGNAFYVSYEKKADGTYKHTSDYSTTDNTMWFVGLNGGNVYIFDKSTGKITHSTNLSDVRDYAHFGEDKASLVMANLTYMSIKSLFVYNE